jgi:protease II
VRDPSSPLVVPEYDEWGDTASTTEANERAKALQYIHSYSPYDNVDSLVVVPSSSPARGGRLRYPAVYLTLGMRDDRVDPVHAMMWTDRIRKRLKLQTHDKLACEDRIIVRIQEHSGHDGPSTVEEQVEEAAMEIAFLESVISADDGR